MENCSFVKRKNKSHKSLCNQKMKNSIIEIKYISTNYLKNFNLIKYDDDFKY